MDELIRNLKTHKLEKKQKQEKKEPKREKSLYLKASKSNSSKDDVDIAYLSKKIIRAIKKSGKFQKRERSSRQEGTVEVFHKYGKLGYFIKDWHLHKMDYKQYLKSEGDKEKKKDQVLNKSRMKATTDYAVKKALVVWGDSLSDSDNVENPEDESMLEVEENEPLTTHFYSHG